MSEQQQEPLLSANPETTHHAHILRQVEAVHYSSEMLAWRISWARSLTVGGNGQDLRRCVSR